jgi:4-aminobutyrate aminotransferase-like enzyme
MPALIITKEQVEEGLQILEQTLTETMIKFDL